MAVNITCRCSFCGDDSEEDELPEVVKEDYEEWSREERSSEALHLGWSEKSVV